MPARFDEVAGEDFYADISGEQLGLLDENDAVVWLQIPGTENATSEAQPGYSTLRVGQEGRVLNLTTEQAVALPFSSVLSLPALLDTVPGELATRVGG